MKDRTIRFASVGAIFILSLLFGIWYTGGDFYSILKVSENDNLKIFELLIAIISTPGIGFIISSTIIGLLRHFSPKTSEFLEPSPEYAQRYLQMIDTEFKGLGSGVKKNEENGNWEIEKHYTLYLNHQILLRMPDQEEVIKFITRRMDIYWTNINTMFSIFMGFLFGFIINFPLVGDCSLKKMLAIIPLVVYFIISISRSKRILKETNDFEKRYLLQQHTNRALTQAGTEY